MHSWMHGWLPCLVTLYSTAEDVGGNASRAGANGLQASIEIIHISMVSIDIRDMYRDRQCERLWPVPIGAYVNVARSAIIM